jgi:hypothetical protein
MATTQKVTLLKPHTHADVQYNAGDEIEVTADEAKFLAHKDRQVIAPIGNSQSTSQTQTGATGQTGAPPRVAGAPQPTASATPAPKPTK